ncbi:hypothetical protein ACWCQP_49890 [Streptomyces chartreusis]
MTVDEILRDALRDQAAEQRPAEPTLADRVLEARRRARTDRIAIATAAATAVVALLVPLFDSGLDLLAP